MQQQQIPGSKPSNAIGFILFFIQAVVQCSERRGREVESACLQELEWSAGGRKQKAQEGLLFFVFQEKGRLQDA